MSAQNKILLFPGQGSQHPGMGKDLVENSKSAQEIFKQADDVLGFSLSTLCFLGPEDRLRQTEITQPAILATSIATLRAIQEIDPHFDFAATLGHSLGEWSAAVACGILAFEDAIKLVHLRGQKMQQAVPEGIGAMSAVMGLETPIVESLCQTISKPDSFVCAANLNAPGQLVLSGHKTAVDLVSEELKKQGAKVVPLQVSAPFHTPLMQPAQDQLKEAVENTPFKDGFRPVISNVTAEPYTKAEDAKALLLRQITAPVRFIDCIQIAGKIFSQTNISESRAAIEIGAGKVLTGLVKRIDKSFSLYTTESWEKIQTWKTKT